MSFKDQLHKLKENWLLILLVVLVLFFSLVFSPLSRVGSQGSYDSGSYDNSYASSLPSFGKMMAAQRVSASYSESYYPSPMEESFAPEVTDRKITTTVSLTT